MNQASRPTYNSEGAFAWASEASTAVSKLVNQVDGRKDFDKSKKWINQNSMGRKRNKRPRQKPRNAPLHEKD